MKFVGFIGLSSVMLDELDNSTNSITMQSSDCIFCKIIAKEIPANVIHEDDHAFAFLDTMQRSPGHTLVIPKIHAPTIVALPDAEVEPLFSAVKKVDQLILSGLKPDGVTIGMNQGRASGQEVDHLHVHLMPRWSNDGGGSIQSVVNNKPKESLQDMRKKILREA